MQNSLYFDKILVLTLNRQSLMKYILLLVIVFVFLFSCNSENDISQLDQIKAVEFSRGPDTTLFSKLSTSGNKNTISLIIESIGKMADASYLPILQRLMRSNDFSNQKAIIFAMGQIGTPKCETLLLKYFENPRFSKLKKHIIESLGRCADKKGSSFLLKNLHTFEDSLKAMTIKNLTFIYKRNQKLRAIRDTVNVYLNYNSKLVQLESIYFFNRHRYLPSFYNLLNTQVPLNSVFYKYKLNGLAKILEKSAPDSLMLDSLKTTLLKKSFYKETDWKKLLYKIKIISFYPDSLITNKIASYLKNENPHVRKEAILALGKIKTELSKNLLLHHYDQTGWSEKGLIILNLAKRYPKFVYRLIQQNLDQGTLFFKEMLLQSLAKINDRMSRAQLKQFLAVPEPRLQAVAFQELGKLRRLTYKNVKPVLLSGNNMLTTYAANWLLLRPKYGELETLIDAYSRFSESKDSETLVSILEVINKLKLSSSISFLDSIYLNTQNPGIAIMAKKGLAEFDIGAPAKVNSGINLFVPDSIIYDSDPIKITILTNKGDIEVELWPRENPLTVSNFLHLIKKGFYKNILFHRVVSDFVIQAGDPTGTGWGGPGYSIPCEYNNKPFVQGSVGMATAGKDTGGSQFFICHSEQPHLNRRYTNFGIVKSGMDVVDKITKDDKILNITIN